MTDFDPAAPPVRGALGAIDPASVPTLLGLLRSQAAAIREIDGSKATTPQAWFRECKRSLSFRSYFGNNWNAYIDCMIDLPWITLGGNVILLRHADRALCEDDEPLDAVIHGLLDAQDWYAGDNAKYTAGGAPFEGYVHVLLTDLDSPERWTAAGATLIPANVPHPTPDS